MRFITSSRPTPALVLAIVALFVALGGTGYAAASLSGKTIRPGSIPGNRVTPNALGGVQINESRLGVVPAAKLAQAAGTARSAERADSARSADSASSADSAKALQGRGPGAFLANTVRVATNQTAELPGPAGGFPGDVSVSCDANEKAIGGGGAWLIPTTLDPTALDAPITASLPIQAPTGEITGWRTAGRNFSATNRILRVYALCVPKNA